jgi:hypothetical protein
LQVACLTSPLGVKLSVVVPGWIVSRAMGVVMIGMSLVMAVTLWGDLKPQEAAAVEPVPAPRRVGLTETNERIAITAALGVVR